jgi:dehydrogenase/reductase SDR family protein 12
LNLLNRTVTPEGLEANFATNTLAPFALTELLLPLLAKAEPPARVIAVSSGGQYTEELVTQDMQWEKEGGFDGARQYARDKRRQTALTERWAADHPKLLFFTMHPGWAGASHAVARRWRH